MLAFVQQSFFKLIVPEFQQALGQEGRICSTVSTSNQIS
jgi:hypothetical protein